jgi:inosine/xanthosine triphosphate pyrophosphatase family protein
MPTRIGRLWALTGTEGKERKARFKAAIHQVRDNLREFMFLYAEILTQSCGRESFGWMNAFVHQELAIFVQRCEAVISMKLQGRSFLD